MDFNVLSKSYLMKYDENKAVDLNCCWKVNNPEARHCLE